jgi:hypothetical protein
MIEIIACDLILHNAAGWKINPLSPAVSLPKSGAVSPAAPANGSKFLQMPSKLTGTANRKESSDAQSLITSTTANLATDSAAGGIIFPRASLYILAAIKSLISEFAKPYNQFLGGLTPWVASFIPLFSRILAAAAFVNSKVNDKISVFPVLEIPINKSNPIPQNSAKLGSL